MKERIVFSTNGAVITICTCKRMKLGLYVTPYIKINPKWIKDVQIRSKTIKFLEENTGVNCCDLVLGNGFLNMTPKA